MTDPSDKQRNVYLSRLRKVLPLVLTIIVLGCFGWFLAVNADYILRHYSLHPGIMTLLAGLTLGMFFIRGLANKLLFRCFGVIASTWDWFALVIISTMTNYLPLSMGLVAKGYLLKRIHALSYRNYAGGQLMLYVIFMGCNGLIGFFVLNVWMRAFDQWLIQLLLLVMVASLGILVFPRRTIGLLRKPFNFDESTLHRIRISAPAIMAYQVVILLIVAAKLYACFKLGDREVPYSACLLFSAATILTRLFSVTPGALGIREFLIGILAVLTGFEMRDAVIAATVDRIVEMIIVFILGSYNTYKISRFVTLFN